MKKLDVLWVDREPGQLPTGFAARGNMTQADLEQLMQEGKMMEEDKTMEQRSRDWWRGVHAAELDEPYNQNETEAWKEGYKHGVYCPSGGTGPQ